MSLSWPPLTLNKSAIQFVYSSVVKKTFDLKIDMMYNLTGVNI